MNVIALLRRGISLVLICTHSYATTPIEKNNSSSTAVGPAVFSGRWQQGELLTGQAPPGAQITLMEQMPVVLPDGRFIVGLDRDAPAKIIIDVSLNGQKWQHQQEVIARHYDVQRINGVEEKYVNPAPELTARIAREAKQISAARARRDLTAAALKPFSWPAKGPISGVFGSQRVFNGVPKRPHYGIDIAGPVGAKVFAPQDGLVTLAEVDLFYSGGTLILDHGLGLTSTCMHLSRVLVKTGQRVKQGDLIALIGGTGRVTGPHLDWRMNWHNQHVDPEPLVRGAPMPEPRQ